MTFYWMMILAPMIASFANVKITKNFEDKIWMMIFILLSIIIGLKHNVGGDWGNYLKSFKYLQDANILELINFRDLTSKPLFNLFVWISWKLTNSLYLANFICSAIFIYGLISLCRTLKYPLVGISIAMPYLIIVAGLGYTRQSAALGFVLLALINIKNSNTKFFGYLFIGILIHQTAIFMLIVGILYNLNVGKHLKKIVFFSLILCLIFASSISRLAFSFYSIDPIGTISTGALFRIGLSMIAVFLFFIKRKEFKEINDDDKLIFILSLMTIALFFLSFSYSGPADRLHTYIMPIQIIIFVNMIVILKKNYLKLIYKITLYLFYITLFFIWINLGQYSTFWKPYKNILVMNVKKIEMYYNEFLWVDVPEPHKGTIMVFSGDGSSAYVNPYPFEASGVEH